MEKTQILSENDIDRVVKRISHEIVEKNKGSESLVFIGVQKRGIPLASRIAENISKFEGTSRG
jgi:pyrimidine operon attenuation protein/uracil phosphoribosyltransferase